jgi:hypothetical protein
MNISFATRVVDMVNGGSQRVAAGWRNRQTRRVLSRMSDHDLADVGFSRDFSGRITFDGFGREL